MGARYTERVVLDRYHLEQLVDECHPRRPAIRVGQFDTDQKFGDGYRRDGYVVSLVK